MAVSAPASRNARCPCGSGRRYKDCHGALGGEGDSVPSPDEGGTSGRRHLMHEALALQQAGDVAGAAARYAAVLRDEPANFDALHMLGVARFQLHDFAAAAPLLEAAIAANPDVAAAHDNLKLVREAQRMAHAEAQLCRVVLPRLAHLCAPATQWPIWAGAATRLDVLCAEHGAAGAACLARIATGVLGASALHAPGVVALVAPRTLLFGLDEPVAAWGELPGAATRALVITRDAPDLVHDRLRELSDQGRHPVHVRCVDRALHDALRISGGLLLESGGPTGDDAS